MKAVILAGGLGSRLSEETYLKPKPMVEIGERPILWHIMKSYSGFGINEFVILLGYKGYVIKEYFANYFLHENDVTLDIASNGLTVHNDKSENWKITLVNTGLHTMTGGRIKRAKDYIGNSTFLLTYGDGVSDLNIHKLIEYHKSHGKKMTMTAVQPEGRFGTLQFAKNGQVESFMEKPRGDNNWINGGFFVCEPSIIDYISEDSTVLEEGPLVKLTKDGELFSYKHHGFWKCMDTLRDKNQLSKLWNSNLAPWVSWGPS